MKTKDSPPLLHPLFPTLNKLQDMQPQEYPSLYKYLDHTPQGFHSYWQHTRQYLLYIGTHKSQQTFDSYRTEIERFLLWLAKVSDKPASACKKSDILSYIDFITQPNKSWVAKHISTRFSVCSGTHTTVANNDWRPFVTSNRDTHKLSQQSLNLTFSVLKSWFDAMLEYGLLENNPIPHAKKDCRYLIKQGAQVQTVKRLSDSQWSMIIETATEMANNDSLYERHLFLTVCLKSLFLRIGEFSERSSWSPMFKHFFCDHEGFWWLEVLGKGNKIRHISVPDDLLLYLKRYRRSRNMTPLPSATDTSPIIHKLRGTGNPTSRHLRRMVQEVFDRAHDTLKRQGFNNEAEQLGSATSHWLRHTGASMALEEGISTLDLAADLGHQSPSTTERIYISSDRRRRAKQGKKRTI